VEVILQWQYPGRVHPKLLEEKTLRLCKDLGATSLQSYLPWSEIEKLPGKIDFSIYDELVEKLSQHNLKWTPFLILGPSYAVPKWFHNSSYSIYARCLEHKLDSKIQSIWNPNLPAYIERFLQIFAEHYKNCELIESVLLGISGSWGEAIYPAYGGYWKNCESFHTHPGSKYQVSESKMSEEI
jgi:hypothetical protein